MNRANPFQSSKLLSILRKFLAHKHLRNHRFKSSGGPVLANNSSLGALAWPAALPSGRWDRRVLPGLPGSSSLELFLRRVVEVGHRRMRGVPSHGFQVYLIAQAHQPRHQSGNRLRFAPLIIVIRTHLDVLGVVGEHLINHRQHVVRQSDDRLRSPLAHGHAPVEGREVSPLGMRCRPCCLTQPALDIAVGLPCPSAHPLAAALPIARTQTRPTGQMFRISIYTHVHPYLGHDGPCRLAINSWDRQQPPDRLLEDRHPPLDLLLKSLYLFLQPLYLTQFSL